MFSQIKIKNLSHIILCFLILIIILTLPSATSFTFTSIAGIISLLILILISFLQGNTFKVSIYSFSKQIPFIIFFIYYNYNQYQEINLYIFAYILLFFIFSFINNLVSKEILKNLYFLFLIAGLTQIILYYISGQTLCFFNFQCQAIERLNFYAGLYRSNSLFFEPGDFACFMLILSSIVFKNNYKIIITDLLICLISLSAGGFGLFITKVFLYYIDLKSIASFIKKLFNGLLEKKNIILLFLSSLLITLIISYFFYKGLGTNRDSSFVSRYDLIYTIRESFRNSEFITGRGFEIYKQLRLVDSLTLGLSVLAVMGLVGVIILFLSTFLITLDMKFTALILMSRFGPSSGYFLFLIYIYFIVNKLERKKSILANKQISI